MEFSKLSPYRRQKIFVTAKVVRLVIITRRQDHTDRSRRKVVDLAPCKWRDIEADVRSIKVNNLARLTIVERYREATGHCDEKLLTSFERMTGARCTARHVVQVKDPLNFERNVMSTLNECKFATRIVDLRQLDHPVSIHW